MIKRMSSVDRKQQILEVLVAMLKQRKITKITTANIARKVGVSEATLYRHFTNKEAMFLDLFTFAEQSVFGFINQINQSNQSEILKIEQIISSLLKFAEQNPGIIYLVINAELITKSENLSKHNRQFFRRLESQFKQNLQLLSNEIERDFDYIAMANLLQIFVFGKWQQFIFTGFEITTKSHFASHWEILKRNFE